MRANKVAVSNNKSRKAGEFMKRIKYCGDYARACFFLAELKLSYGVKGQMVQTKIGSWVVEYEDPYGNLWL